MDEPNEEDRNQWYCYICGKLLGKTFVLGSMSGSTDRVFLMHIDCAEQCEEQVIKIPVQVM